MARLPTPGSDDNQWGDILNDFLNAEHNADGTQKTLDVSKGGTGATSASGARTNLGTIADNDARLTDERTPLDDSVTNAKVPAGANIAQSKIAGLQSQLSGLADDALAGQEIGYGENKTLLTTSSATGIDVPGCSVVIPPGTRPVVAEWGGTAYNSDASGGITSLVLLMSTDGGAYDTIAQRAQFKSSIQYEIGDIHKSLRLSASTSTRTVKLVLARLSGTANLQGQVDGQETYLHVWQV